MLHGRGEEKETQNIPSPSLTITNLRVQAISQIKNLTFTRRQSPPQAPRGVFSRPRARLVRMVVAAESASVMPWKSGARAAAAAFCWRRSGFSGAAAVVLST